MSPAPSIVLASVFACAAPFAGAQVIISEFLADNDSGIKDQFDNREDWIELLNTGSSPVNLDGWWISDKSTVPGQWRFPALTLNPGATLLLWASGRDLRNPANPLHTNFSLAKGGEFLGLYKPDDITGQPVLVDSFGSAYPAQITDVSYGRSNTNPVLSGETIRYRVLPSSTTSTAYFGTNYAGGELGHNNATGWNVSPAFNDASWSSGATGIGYDTGGLLTPYIATNIQASMRNVGTSILLRRNFQIPVASNVLSAKLRIRYEDGFIAWINGNLIGSANFSGTPGPTSAASAALNSSIPQTWTEINIPPSYLSDGTNLLAIQGLNVTSGSSDFLILPEIQTFSAGSLESLSYFSPPTPNALNGAGLKGPLLSEATPQDPDIPRPLGNASSPPLTVTLRATRTFNPITAIRAYTRTMYQAESSAIALNDQGTGADAIAGDGIWSGTLPTSGVGAAQMFRWRFEAVDSQGNTTRLPAYADPLDSPRYFGTVAQSTLANHSQLPVLEWFVEGSPANGPTTEPFRGSMYYLGHFYDNIGHKIHGQTTAGFAKKSYDFDSNDNHRFLWKIGETKVKDLNLLTNYADKTKIRNTLSHEIGSLAGATYHFTHPVRVHLNAVFHGVMDLVEDGDDRMLERNGLNPEGAFYKIYAENLTTAAEKKTRTHEPNTDLTTFANALNTSLPLDQRLTYAYDNLNIPATVNYLVVRQFNSDRDHGHKNFYLYRDTNRTNEWQPIIWDVDLSQGHNWNGDNGTGGYFNDTLSYANPLNAHSSANRVYNLILESPDLRAMFLRRMRTLMDSYLQPPGTPNPWLEQRMRTLVATIDPDPANPSPLTDGDIDATRWGIHSNFIQNRPREEVERVVSGYVANRRNFLYNTASNRPLLNLPGVSGGDPIPDSPQSAPPGSITIDSIDYLPASGNQNQEYVILRNNTAHPVDLSGWKLTGGIQHQFLGGTVILPGNGSAAANYKGLFHVVKDAAAFRARSTGPTGGQKRLIQGNYSGQLSARGESIQLLDASNQLIATFTYPGSPTPLQQYLRLTEIHYHPTPPTSAESFSLPGATEDDFEYLEFINIGPSPLQLQNARFTSGPGWTFPAHSLAPGARLVLARNPAAFELRYPEFSGTVLGPYEGTLPNSGGRLELVDPVGENILDFDYKDGWYPATDGDGYSLVLRDPYTPFDDFGNPARWAISGEALGSPGVEDPYFSQAYYGWDNFHFTSAERDTPAVSAPEADPDLDGISNWDEYALGLDPRTPDRPLFEFAWADTEEGRRPALRFRRPLHAVDLTYELTTSTSLDGTWEFLGSEAQTLAHPTLSTEEILLYSIEALHDPTRFFQLIYTRPF